MAPEARSQREQANLSYLKDLKAVITAGGLGTRLLPFSKEIPKEMSPILTNSAGGDVQVKPIIHAIYEQLYSCGVRDFYIVVGRGKGAIQDYFSPDPGFVEMLERKHKDAESLRRFYEILGSSNLVFIVQPEPVGFGDAVLRVRPYINGDFLLHAGDTYIISRENGYLKRLKQAHSKYESDATILLQDVDDPRQFGVVSGNALGDGVLDVKEAVEKPARPKSKTAIMPVYIFNNRILDALARVKPGKGGELQLTDGIQTLISEGRRVVGVKLRREELRLDIGSPETLIEALRLSEQYLGTANGQKHRT